MTEKPLIPALCSEGQVQAEVNGVLGVIVLNRPQALNALSLAMIRDLRALLSAWKDDARIEAVLIVGQAREGKPPAFCAGGDIRFFHTAALAKDRALEDFFTEEYALNHEIHVYPKPYIALMDGIVMGGGMGITQGAKLRVVNERSKLAMPEAHIGLFPDVGGGWFLAQCPGHVGEWLALSGQVLGPGDAIAWGLADVYVPADEWTALEQALRQGDQPSAERVVATVMQHAAVAPAAVHGAHRAEIDHHFGQADMNAVLASLTADGGEWAHKTLNQLHHNSPLAMAISLELVRRGRHLTLADDLRLERTLVQWCFEPAWRDVHCETVEGIRALAVDKDKHPRWQPATMAEVTPAQVAAMFVSPWPADQHPLAHLQDPV